MPVQISTDHPTLALRPKIQEVCNNFLTTFGFNYFQYLRCYHDGSISLLTNNTSLVEYFQHRENEPLVFSSYEKNYENAHSYWFLWDEELPEFPVRLAKEMCHIHNGLTLVRRSKDYYDMIAVALPNEQENAGGFYLNKLKGIEEYIKDFETANKDLISIITKHRIVLPEPYRDVNYKEMCLSKGRITITGKFGTTYITTQELACMRFLLQGASYKQIAKALMISTRTIETYMLRVRQRTGWTTRLEIKRMLSLSSTF